MKSVIKSFYICEANIQPFVLPSFTALEFRELELHAIALNAAVTSRLAHPSMAMSLEYTSSLTPLIN